jgi:RNA polymerase sigma factor (sigma-70 family)
MAHFSGLMSLLERTPSLPFGAHFDARDILTTHLGPRSLAGATSFEVGLILAICSVLAFCGDCIVNGMDDRELLREYVGRRSQDAFHKLVERHLPMVYSAARRIVHDAHLAEEVAQNVFTTLARKAKSIRPPQVVGGWLYNTTRHLSLNAARGEQRRREREQTAVAMQTIDWVPDDPRLSEHLEPAMAELAEDDRDALVLRYLENRTLRDVGAELGISEDAARMRVNRALERLRAGFSRHGVAVSAVILAGAMTASASAVPSGLAAAIGASAFVGAQTSAVAGAASTKTSATIAPILQKALIALALTAAAGAGIYEAQKVFPAKPEHGRFTPIALDQVGGKPLANYPPGKDWTAVPQGHQTFGGVPFDVLAKLQLQGIVDATNNRMYPARFIGIPVRQRLARLHLFHGANVPDRVERPIAALRLHYADGAVHTLFITYGVHVRHWWREYGETDHVNDTNSVLAWSGRSPDSDTKNTTHRLYKSSFDLPSSAQRLESIDIFTLFGDSSYVVLALTGEAPSDDVKISRAAPHADDTQFRDDLTVKVSDSAGNPIRGAGIRGVAIRERARDYIPLAKMGDSFEEVGTVPVDFPTGTRELQLVASAPGFVARELNLKPSGGKRFNREVSVKLEPGVRIGGFVRDTDGNPVTKAKVEVLRPTYDGSGNVLLFKYGETTSNSQGRWKIDEAPEALDNLLFHVTHKDFRRGEFEISGDTGTGHLTRDALLKTRAEFMLVPQ